MNGRPKPAARPGLGGRARDAKLRQPGWAHGVFPTGNRMNDHAGPFLHGNDPLNVGIWA